MPLSATTRATSAVISAVPRPRVRNSSVLCSITYSITEAAQVRAGDLQQLERIAQQFPARERFLSELALDPPQASGDLAGPPAQNAAHVDVAGILRGMW